MICDDDSSQRNPTQYNELHLVAVVGCAEKGHQPPVMLHLVTLVLDLHNPAHIREVMGIDSTEGLGWLQKRCLRVMGWLSGAEEVESYAWVIGIC